ncbi:hypothetical protein IW140_001203 [Coemansia sp. RSA 1813]|nr:hypothetical protein LPJ74_001722 [Coemansia sp. RSA 1843]KAJ2216852.1 hypothetical protein EV179_000886 [Coemansia sp. RSA 487]KAJ2571854.1 hypothetical protein IW140_001203 [Coemansia sp. RSA 1813]
MSMICEAPVYANIISLDTLAADSARGSHRASDKFPGDMCVVLTENGHVSLVYIEEICDGRHRFRLCDEIKPSCYLDQAPGDMLQPLRKIVNDPHSRAIGIVTWINSFELLLLDWTSIGGTLSRPENTRPLHHCVGLQTDIGEAILDTAILVSSDPESQRILLVAAIVATEPYQQFCLSLYETWVRRSADELRSDPSLNLLENLPLPSHTTEPLHIIPLPAFPECFLLLTYNEIIFVSSLQILSGDVFLHRVKLPETNDGDSDPVRAFCVAGTTFVDDKDGRKDRDSLRSLEELSGGSAIGSASPRSLILSDQRHGRSSNAMLVQKVYITLHSGRLYRVYTSSKPFIEVTEVSADHLETSVGETGAFPAGDTLIYMEPYSDPEASGDRLLVSGDCADHSIILVSEHQTGSAGVLAKPTFCQQITPVFENHCPVTSLILQRDRAYWTSGRATTASVQQAQFGHFVRTETILEMSIDEDQQHDRHVATRLWALNSIEVPGSSGGHDCVNKKQRISKQLSRVVLHNECSGVPVVEDELGSWKIDDALQHAVSSPDIVLVSDLSNKNAVVSSTGLLRIFRHRIDIVDISASDRTDGSNEHTEAVLASTADGEVFVHGTCCQIGSKGRWLIATAVHGKAESSRVVIALAQKSREKGFEQIHEAEKVIYFDAEIACLRAFVLGESVILLVGTHSCKVHTYRLDADATHKLEVSFDIAQAMRSTFKPQKDTTSDDGMDVNIESAQLLQIESHWIPNDVYLLYAKSTMYILVGLRDGHMVSVAVSIPNETQDEAHPLVLDTNTTAVGQAPVSFVQLSDQVSHRLDGQEATGHILQAGVLTDSLYIACLEDIGLVRVSACFGKDEPLRPIHSLVPIAKNEAKARIWRCFAIHRDGDASVLTIPFDRQCYLHDFYVGNEPRQLVFDDDTGMMLVAGAIFPNSFSPNVPPTSYLQVLDPCDGGQMHAEIRFHSYEMALSLVTWHIHGQKRYRYICVGTGLYMEQSGCDNLSALCSRPKGGRLIIYNLKTIKRKGRTKAVPSSGQTSSTSLDQIANKGGYELKYVWESERDSPVVALAPLGDSYLVVGVGKICVVLKLDVVQKRLIECCETPLRFPITSLHVRGHDVVAGSQREAVNVLRFVPAQSDDDYDKLLLQNSARFGVNTVDACYLSDSIVAGVDNTGFLYAVAIPASNSEFGLDRAFGICLGTECSQIRQGCLVKRMRRPGHVLSWAKESQTNEHDDSDKDNVMQPEDSVVVSTVSGAMWTLVRISDQAFALLEELERVMCSFDCGHPAKPLVAAGESIDRARRKSSLQSSNVIDGTLSTTFLNGLALSEQLQVVASSEELRRLSLVLDIADKGVDQETAPQTNERIVQIICRLIWTINYVCTC